MASLQRSLPRGIALIVVAFFCSAMTGFIGKFTHGDPLSITVFLQYFVSLAFFAPSALRRGPRALASRHAPLLVVRSLAGSGAQLLFFFSLGKLTLLDASLLSNASPLFIPLIVLVWLHKPVSPAVAASLVVGLAGVVLVIHPGPELFRDPTSLVALASALLSAIGLVTTNELTRTDPPSRILFYNFAVSSVVLLPYAALTFRPLPLAQIGLLLLIGVFFALTQWCVILAYQYASASELSPFNYSVVVFSGLLGWIFLHDSPSLGAIAGTVLIIAGGVLSIELGHREGLGHTVGSGHWTLRPLHPPWSRKRRDATATPVSGA